MEEQKCDKSFFSVSCETQNRLRDCLKQVLCDLLRCVEREFCPDGKLAIGGAQQRPSGERLLECLGGVLCSAVACLPNAICPEEPPQELPPCDLPCDFAVEEPN